MHAQTKGFNTTIDKGVGDWRYNLLPRLPRAPPQLRGEDAKLAEGERERLPPGTLSRAHQHFAHCNTNTTY